MVSSQISKGLFFFLHHPYPELLKCCRRCWQKVLKKPKTNPCIRLLSPHLIHVCSRIRPCRWSQSSGYETQPFNLLEAQSLAGRWSIKPTFQFFSFFFFFMETICPFLTFSNSHLLYHQQLEALQIDLFTKDSFSAEISRNGIELKDLPLTSTSIQVDERANFSKSQHRNITF